MSNQTLSERLRAGDSKLLEGIYRDHLASVVRWIMANNGSQDDANDIFQDTLEALIHRSFKDENMRDDHLGAFILQIAKNKWIDRLRRKKTFDKVRTGYLERLDTEYNIEDQYISVEKEHEKQRIIKSTFEKLTEVCKRLLTMLLQEKPTEDIVKELDMTNANTMYRRKHACLNSWKSHIQKIKDNDAI